MIAIHIVIAGGGKVGSFLAEKLAKKNTIVVIEKDPITCEKLYRTTDALVIQGDACNYRYQEEARVGRADVFAAVTGDDDDNLVACQLAKSSFNVPRTVARVNNPKNERIFNLMGTDAISSTTIIGHLIEEKATIGDILTLQVLKSGKAAIVEIDIPEAGCCSCNKRLKDLGLPDGCVLVSILRGQEVIIPRGKDVILPGDSVIAVTSTEKESDLKKSLVG
ncbi:MAG: NAD-binding protein [Actinobacteria bacterium]|nr:NAD-binding protein [Actinomycetota bacterium]